MPKFLWPRSISPKRPRLVRHLSARSFWDHPRLLRMALILIPTPAWACRREGWRRG